MTFPLSRRDQYLSRMYGRTSDDVFDALREYAVGLGRRARAEGQRMVSDEQFDRDLAEANREPEGWF